MAKLVLDVVLHPEQNIATLMMNTITEMKTPFTAYRRYFLGMNNSDPSGPEVKYTSGTQRDWPSGNM